MGGLVAGYIVWSPSNIRANLSSNEAGSATGTELGKKRLAHKQVYFFEFPRSEGDWGWVLGVGGCLRLKRTQPSLRRGLG